MNQFLKKMNTIRFIYLIYFFLMSTCIITFIFIAPYALFFSKIINDKYNPPPEFIYGAPAFVENNISDIGALTSVYRGSFKRNGVYKNIIPLNLKVLWKSFEINGAIHGASKASPAVDNSGVYVGGDDGWFYAFNHDGSLRWKYYAYYSMRGIHSTAMLSEKYIWFGAYNGRLYCLNKLNGDLMWSLKLADAIGSSPLLYKGFIYLSVETTFLEGYVLKINAATGEVIWRSPWLGEQIHSSVSLNPKRNLLYVGANNGVLYALHENGGSIFWSYDAKQPIKGTPIVSVKDDNVYFSDWDGSLTALGAGTGRKKWVADIESPSQSTPTEIPKKDILIISTHRRNSNIFGVKKSTGQILWKKKLSLTRFGTIGLHSGFSARNLNKRWLYYGVCSEKIFCILDPETGKTLKEIKIDGSLTGAPVPYKQFIYLSLNNGGLLKLGK